MARRLVKGSEDFFPAPKTAPGWERVEGIRRFTLDTLYAYVDGDADIYLRYGLHSAATLDLENPSLPESTVTIDIFEMGSPLQAFGAYCACRAEGASVAGVGQAAFFDEGLLGFYQDRWFVKLFSKTASKTVTRELLCKLGASMAHGMPGAGALPRELGILPPTNLVPDSAQYLSDRPLGLEVLCGGMVATYRVGSREVKVAAMAGRDDAHAREILQTLAKEAGTTASDQAQVHGELRTRGRLSAVRRGRFVVCALPAASGDESLLITPLLDRMEQLAVRFPEIAER